MKMMTTAEAATALGCTPNAVRHYVARGRLTRHGRRGLDQAEVERLHIEIWGTGLQYLAYSLLA